MQINNNIENTINNLNNNIMNTIQITKDTEIYIPEMFKPSVLELINKSFLSKVNRHVRIKKELETTIDRIAYLYCRDSFEAFIKLDLSIKGSHKDSERLVLRIKKALRKAYDDMDGGFLNPIFLDYNLVENCYGQEDGACASYFIYIEG